MTQVDDGQAQAITNQAADEADDPSTAGTGILPAVEKDVAEVLTAASTLTADDTGKTFFLSAAAGFETILPTATLGFRFRFFVKTAPTSNGYTITGAPADVISGTVAASGAETIVNGVTATLADNVILVANQAIVGDYVEFVSDGSLWYVTGNVNTFAAITANG